MVRGDKEQSHELSAVWYGFVSSSKLRCSAPFDDSFLVQLFLDQNPTLFDFTNVGELGVEWMPPFLDDPPSLALDSSIFFNDRVLPLNNLLKFFPLLHSAHLPA